MNGGVMKRLLICTFLLLVPVARTAVAADDPKKVDNFTLEDASGVKHALSDYTSNKAIVLMFIATRCPVSNSYNERMAALDKDYREKGVVFLGINANKEESSEEIRNHAKEHGFAFTILKDAGNKVADKLEASVTPEMYVLSPKLELLYHGRIDDNSRGTSITSNDLRKALDEILAGKPVSVTRTKAFGCSIKRVGE
jgi:peroxiredoxin